MPRKKYSLELKIEIVDYVIIEKHTSDEAERKYQIDDSIIRKWVSLYKTHGITGLERQTQRYTAEFKETVVKDMRENHLSLRETANKYNIGMHTSISKWERIYLTEGLEGLQKERRGQASKEGTALSGRKPVFKKEASEDLLAEVQRLRMENEYLKKLSALVHTKVK